MIELSRRLQAVADLVTPGSRLADVGCDHGYLSIYLVQSGKVPRSIAMDVNRGPLLRAQEHIRQYGLEEYIETRLSDGLTRLKAGEADTLVLAGMGGPLMEKILEEGREALAGMGEMILQPQSEIPAFRRYLQEQGYCIAGEDMVWEEGKYYPIMWAVPGKMHWERAIDFRYGRHLLEAGHPVLMQYLQEEEQGLRSLEEHLQRAADAQGGSPRARERLKQIREELAEVEEAKAYEKRGGNHKSPGAALAQESGL